MLQGVDVLADAVAVTMGPKVSFIYTYFWSAYTIILTTFISYRGVM